MSPGDKDAPPSLVFADAGGRIMDVPDVQMAGAAGQKLFVPESRELIELPEGSELFLLPGRAPVGFDPEAGRFTTLYEDPFTRGDATAVAAFVAPAHTGLYTCAYETLPGAGVLPLFAYTAVGWKDGSFYAAAKRVDPSARQEFPPDFEEAVAKGVRELTGRYPENRLIRHLSGCALDYGCPAAKNLFMGREEAPLPASRSCNADCLGCISLQPESSGIPATQPRITFTPTPEEIAEVALVHFERVEEPVASFGQGCEGEPLTVADTIAGALKIVREKTDAGTLNMNTNASLPEILLGLRKSGLDSIRVSALSFREEPYHRYHRPLGYGFEDVVSSIRLFKEAGGFVSVNYLIMPGFTDTEEEMAAFFRYLNELKVDFVQLRNLNIDPEYFFREMGPAAAGEPFGVTRLIEILKRDFPGVGTGYFNPFTKKRLGDVSK